MATVDSATCPSCGAGPGTLTIETGLRAKPLGTFSLAGGQMKVSAVEVPVLRCSACDLQVEGQYDDERHVVFPPPTEEG